MPRYTQNKPSAGFQTLPEGLYWVKVENAEDEIAKTSKNEMIKLTLAVSGHSNKLFERLVFSESSFWKIDQVRAALGFEVNEGEDVDVNADDFIGQEGIVRVGHEDYMGKPQARIAQWLVDPEEIEEAKQELEAADEETAADTAKAEAAAAAAPKF